MTIAAIAGIIGIATAAAKGIANAVNRKVQANETRSQLATAKSNLEATYNQNIKQLNESYNLTTQQTINARDTALTQSAKSIEMQNQIYNEQKAELAVQASQAEGQAIQQVANSGFRNVGSANNVVKDTNSTYARTQSKLNSQIALSKYQNYNSALNNYTDANAQLEQYKLKMEQQKESLTLEFNQEYSEITGDIAYMNSTKFKILQGFGYATDLLDAGVDTMTRISDYQTAKKKASESAS